MTFYIIGGRLQLFIRVVLVNENFHLDGHVFVVYTWVYGRLESPSEFYCKSTRDEILGNLDTGLRGRFLQLSVTTLVRNVKVAVLGGKKDEYHLS